MFSRSSKYLAAAIVMSLVIGCSGSNRSQETPESVKPVPSASPESVTPSPTVVPTVSASPTAPSTSTPSVSVPPEKSPQASPTPSKDDQLISKLKEEVETNTAILKDNSGRINLNRILLAQKAQWLVSGTFTQDLTALDGGVPVETDNYKFTVAGSSPQQITLSAIAKKAKLPSYSGSVYSVQASLPISGICQTQVASTTAPSPPTLKNGKLSCGANAILIQD